MSEYIDAHYGTNGTDRTEDEIAQVRRRILGDVIVDDEVSPVASASRSAFRLGWNAARETTPEPGISECTSACGLDQDGGHWHSLGGFVWAQFPRRHRTVTPTIPNHGTDAT